MRKKTESLMFPTDSLAAMRELQELNSQSPQISSPGVNESQSHGVAQSTKKKPTDDLDEIIRNIMRRIVERKTDITTNFDSILEEAMKQSLIAPFKSPPEKGPFTVTSVKMSMELWQRVGLAANLTGRPKQEIVAEALEIYIILFLGAGVTLDRDDVRK